MFNLPSNYTNTETWKTIRRLSLRFTKTTLHLLDFTKGKTMCFIYKDECGRVCVVTEDLNGDV